MPVVINGSTGISGTDGSAGTPAYQGTDTNTGVFFPAADTIAFAEGGVEAMRIDSSGNVGIGTNAPGARLDLFNGGSAVAINMTASGNGSALTVDPTFTRLQTANNVPVTFGTNGTERGRFDGSGNFQFNSGYGSVAVAYGCRAWVNFNGTGVVAIRASGNVTSITDNGTGDYTVNLTTAMPDANYAAGVLAQNNSGANADEPMVCGINGGVSPTTSAVRLNYRRLAGGGGTIADPVICTIAVFR